MNNFRMKVLEYDSPEEATEELNDYITHLNSKGVKVLDITSHVVTDGEGYYCYTFILKIQGSD